MLVWIDLETTGLDPYKNTILEVAAIVTDDNFNEVARYTDVAHYYDARRIVEVFAGMRELGIQEGTAEYNTELERLSKKTELSTYVLEMHWKNGLWRDCAQCWRGELSNVDEALAKFIRGSGAQTISTDERNLGELIKPQLAGSTISFDREFMRDWHDCGRGLPLSLEELHYRNLDVSTLNEIARRVWPLVWESRPNNETKAHRGMADIEESIRVLKHYLANLLPTQRPPCTL